MFTQSRHLPVIHQAEKSECALTCLAMVLNYHGHKIDLNSLRYRYQLSQHGMTLKTLVSISSAMRLAARPLRLEPDDLKKLSLPAILHWKLDHFVVLAGIKGGMTVIHDPATGRREITNSEVNRHFTGVALELIPTADFKEQDERKQLQLGELWRNCSGVPGYLVQLLILSLMLQFFAIAMPFYTQILLDDVLVNYDTDLLTILAAAFLLLTLFRQITELLRSHIVLYLGNKVSFQFATRLCSHLLHLPQDYFSRRHLGDVVSRFGSIKNLRDFLCSGIVEIVVDGLMVMATLTLMIYYSKLLTILALIGVFGYGLIRLLTFSRLQACTEEWINDQAVENSVFMENVSAIQGIKLSNRESARLASWQNCYVSAINSGIKVQKLGINIQFTNGLLTSIENIVLLLVGSYSVIGGTLSIGMLMAFISFKDHFYRSMFSLVDKLFELKVLDIHLARLADIAFCKPETAFHLNIGANNEFSSIRKIALENIAYRYGADDNWLFRNISLQLHNNEKVALIGPTGCGKSTLLKIAASLITPEQGNIRCNDVRVDRNNLSAFRRSVTGVMQNDSLLSGSILENITFFDTTPDHDKAFRAAKLACIAAEISKMPMQYHTMVGSMGAALSGGQIQRILIARAIYQEPGFLVLDEATSHLDIQTEAEVNRNLKNLSYPCLMTAHRPETVLQADSIYLLLPEGLRQIRHQEYRDMVSNKHEDDVITI